MKSSQQIDVPIELLFENPTIEQLAEKLYSQQMSAAEDQQVSKLNPNGRQNLFCFPPISGFGIFFKDLASHLDHKAVVYGFNFIEEDQRIEQYVNTIMDIQPEGPYVLLGYSAGGNLAFEVVQAMEQRGLEVSDYIIVDAYRKGVTSIDNSNDSDEAAQRLPESVREAVIKKRKTTKNTGHSYQMTAKSMQTSISSKQASSQRTPLLSICKNGMRPLKEAAANTRGPARIKTCSKRHMYHRTAKSFTIF